MLCKYRETRLLNTAMKPERLEDNWRAAPRDIRLIAIDQGEKTLGLALADPGQTIATPFKTLARGKLAADAQVLRKIMADYEVGGIILGFPLNMDGTQGRRAQAVKDYAIALQGHFPDMWIALWDERLSTYEATRGLIDDMDLSRAKRGQVIDAAAAQVILQSALDYLARHREA